MKNKIISKAKKWLKDKKGLEMEMLGWWILGIAVLIVVVIAIMIMKGKGHSALDFIKNLFRFKK
jgi:multisubunit Na+/H+ antiporter MnhB subunit